MRYITNEKLAISHTRNKGLKILLISSVLPKDSTGGEVVLFRHLNQLSEVSVVMVTDASDSLLAESSIQLTRNPILNRLSQTRLARWVHDIRQCFNTFDNYQKVVDYIQSNKPDLIVTVAHGELSWLALDMSEKFNLPLVTFFHDWWPDAAYIHNWMRGIIEGKFQRLYQKSHLALCVSEGMRQGLGNHSNAEILYPIPEIKQRIDYRELMGKPPGNIISSSEEESHGKFEVIYAGNISDIYGSMVQDLWQSYLVNNEFELRLFGPQPDWSNSLVAEVKKQGIYVGFISRDLLNKRLSQANALLVAMSFKAGDKKRMETSFPSKLVEYCQFGKPIIIWGPEYSSSVRWGSANQAALLVTSPLGEDLVKAINKLVRDREKQEYLGHKAWEMAQGMFNPENIQRQFAESIERVVANYKL